MLFERHRLRKPFVPFCNLRLRMILFYWHTVVSSAYISRYVSSIKRDKKKKTETGQEQILAEHQPKHLGKKILTYYQHIAVCLLSKILSNLENVRKHTLNGVQITNIWLEYELFNMNLVLRKPVFGFSDQVRHKPGCTIKEDG